MNSAVPRPWAVRGIEVAVLLLPAGRVRDRYRQELAAELWGLGHAQQLGHVLSVLASAAALRRALVEAGEVEFRHTRLWCALLLHHRWRLRSAEDGSLYRRCCACGRDDDETVRHRVAGSMLIAHGPPQ
jgi:hypothetical protein